MSENFARAALRVAIVQLAHCHGYHSIQRSALDTLTDVAQRYLEALGYFSHQISELSGRTESNALDVMHALEDLRVDIDDLIEFSRLSDDIPFAKCIQPFPIPKKVRTFNRSSDSTTPSNIPSQYPPFPPLHTYMKTIASVDQTADEKEIQRIAKQHNQEAEEAYNRIISPLPQTISQHWGTIGTAPSSATATPIVRPTSSATLTASAISKTPGVSTSGPTPALPAHAHENPFLKGAAKRKRGEGSSAPNLLTSPRPLSAQLPSLLSPPTIAQLPSAESASQPHE
eukprot:TRINITY_DN1883_c0_g3_i1.p1 TRINITY_DN1883_c0_g3~~TRINITY_DN1883_c0_g3_i1.p1  ORF type:complete len:285 (-),score=66.66 TRINITY_DN1883_c0_g3_i1:189-1043(-)